MTGRTLAKAETAEDPLHSRGLSRLTAVVRPGTSATRPWDPEYGIPPRPEHLLFLQRTAGNGAVTRLIAEAKAAGDLVHGSAGAVTVQRSAKPGEIRRQAIQDYLMSRVVMRRAAEEIRIAAEQRGRGLVQEPKRKLPSSKKRIPSGKESRFHPYTKRRGAPPNPPEVQTVVQRAATATGYGGGHLNDAAAKAPGAAAPNLAISTLNFGNVTAANTSTSGHCTDLNRQQSGAGVGATRPNGWWPFVAMLGGFTPFVQGHTVHQDLNGDGLHDNLSPFTRSLNGLHYNRAELPVIRHTDAPPRNDEFAHYAVNINYGGNPGLAAHAIFLFNNLVVLSIPNACAAMVGAGVITPPQAVVNVANNAIPPADIVAANTWLTNYVNNTFPASIGITATFIDDAGGGAYDATAPQVINITNDI